MTRPLRPSVVASLLVFLGLSLIGLLAGTGMSVETMPGRAAAAPGEGGAGDPVAPTDGAPTDGAAQDDAARDGAAGARTEPSPPADGAEPAGGAEPSGGAATDANPGEAPDATEAPGVTSPLDDSDPAASLGDTGPVPAIPARRLTAANAVVAGQTGWAGWALLDRRNQQWYGSPTWTEVNNTESMVKVWVAAELLIAAQGEGRMPTATERRQISAMIRESDDGVTESVYRRLGETDVIERLIDRCGLLDTSVDPDGNWAQTQMSPRDAVRMGLCILPDAGVLTPAGSALLLAEMRAVNDDGSFGIQTVAPAGSGVPVARKNGWTANWPSGTWNLNCLGLWGEDDRWVLAVETRYPVELGQDVGVRTCEEVTRALFG